MNGKHNELFIMLHGDKCFGRGKAEQNGGKKSGLQFKQYRSHGEGAFWQKVRGKGVMPISGKGGEGISYGTVQGIDSCKVQGTKSVRGRVFGDERNSTENGVGMAGEQGTATRDGMAGAGGHIGL